MIDLNPISWGKKFVKLLRDTPAEILILASLGLTVGLGIGYKHESDRAKLIPVGFSEISQMEKDSERRNEEIGPMARYLTSVNDTTMKVFECMDIANKRTYTGNNLKSFASELEFKMDPSFRIHKYELYKFLPALPQQAKNALDELSELIEVRNEMNNVNGHFQNSWNDSHIDHYRTEVRTETYTDSEGHTHTRTYTVEVYDHTTHTYDYDKPEGEEASKDLDKVIKEHPSIAFTEKITPASKTNADGEYAAETSREKKKGQIMFEDKEYMAIARTWYTGSTLMTNLPIIYQDWTALQTDSNQWREAKNTANSASYNTYSHSDPGPKEFQVARLTLDHGLEFTSSISEIVNGIEYVKVNAPVLEKKIREFIAVELDYKQGNGKKARDEIMAMSKKFYTLNFKSGFDIERFRAEVVAALGLAGAVAGGLAGWGVDALGNKYWFRRKDRFF